MNMEIVRIGQCAQCTCNMPDLLHSACDGMEREKEQYANRRLMQVKC